MAFGAIAELAVKPLQLYPYLYLLLLSPGCKKTFENLDL
jgi:hypothetical protein|eukprot:COSAG01_NODE_3167_length_6474_cov_2.587765_8_plen_39_part_00